ncbi:MAG: glycosyltransferase [Spirochaetia bacterium]|nr:glycosyltransferase [Spirochaetia bacterium]
MRGGEVVLEAILGLFPDAELFTLIHNKGSVSETISNRPVHASFVDRLPLKSRFYRHYLPLFPTAIELFDFRGYDLIVSSSHCVAKGVIPPPGVPHICYVHSPMRYVWDMYHDYFPYKGIAGRFVIPFFSNYLRMWDSSSSHRVDRFLCNSAFVAQRISKYYGRSAAVVPPPCVTDGHKVPVRKKDDGYYIVLSALVPYKRIDLAIDAFRQSGRELVVVGRGPEEVKLRRMGGPGIHFTGELPRQEAIEMLKSARGLVFPGVEDFGIVPVEAQSLGVPVIAYGRGGALETVVDRKTGSFFDDQTADSLNAAVEAAETQRYKTVDFQKSVNRFTLGAFQSKLKAELSRLAAKGRTL